MPKPSDPHRPVLLDTHVWIWLAIGARDRLKSAALRILEEAAARDSLRISAITPWEIAVLHGKGRLRLSEDPLDWIRSTLRLTHAQLVPLSAEIAVESERLPGSFHGDPADRIIVASAIASGSALATADRDILRYGEAERLEMIACG